VGKLYFLILFVICASVTQAQRAPVAVNDTGTVPQGGTALLNVLANDSNFILSDSVCITTLWGGHTGWDSIKGCSMVSFHPLVPAFIGLDTFFYRSCEVQHTTLCDTGMVIVTVTLHAPVANPDSATCINGSVDTITVLANDINYDPSDSIRVIDTWGASGGWSGVLDSTFILYYSTDTNYYGLDSFYYSACDTRITGLCDTGLIVVNVVRAPLAPDYTLVVGSSAPLYINLLLNDSNFNVHSSVCVDSVWGLPAGWDSIAGCGQVLYRPHSACDTFYYSLCYTRPPVLCDTGMVIIILSKPVPDFTWYEQDSLCITDVYNNSLLADSVTWTVQYLSNNGQNETLGNVNQFQLSASMPDSAYNVLVCQTAYNAIGDSTVCYPFWIQCTVGSNGIKEITTSHLTIYPDPASDRIQIGISGTAPADMNGFSSVVIYDMVGKELKAIPISETGTTISVSDLSPGIYMIALLDKEQNKKLISRFEVMR
jgi:hypothetical protein